MRHYIVKNDFVSSQSALSTEDLIFIWFLANSVTKFHILVKKTLYRAKVLYNDTFHLKVVGNEKGGGLGGWLLFEDGFGPWRSMSVCFLTL